MKVIVTKAFTDKTRLGQTGAYREAGQEFECSETRYNELSKLDYVKRAEEATSKSPSKDSSRVNKNKE